MRGPSRSRAALWVVVLAGAAYANSIGNGFAYDDDVLIVMNPVVTEARWDEALGGPYWRTSSEEGMLWRPVTLGALALEWRLWKGEPAGFHAVNVALHAIASLLVFLLAAELGTVAGAALGASVFALHPVHVEAVANVVGVAELLAAVPALLACLLYLRRPTSPWGRGARVAGLVTLYLLAMAAKEIAVTLPALLVLVGAAASVWRRRAASAGDAAAERYAARPEPAAGLLSRVRPLAREAPTFAALGAALLAYLGLRVDALGSVLGEASAPGLLALGDSARLLTAVSLWPHYVRLLLFPVELSADYAPAVIPVVRSFTPEVLAGVVALAALAAGVALAARRSLVLALSIAWIVVAVLPVSNLLFPVGTLLAERTLYLPSVGLALAVAAGMPERIEPRARRTLLAGVSVVLAALGIRTVLRNPVWFSTFTVAESVHRDHPESMFAQWRRAEGLARVGAVEDARDAFETALALAPHHYGLLCRVAEFFYGIGDSGTARALLERARDVMPRQHAAHRLLAAQLIERGPAREGHRVALEGLALAGADPTLWALVSESYVVKGDLEAAVRARRAALGLDPHSADDWRRLGELLSALGRHGQAQEAHQRAGAA